MAYEREDKYKGKRTEVCGKETVASMKEVRDTAAEIDAILGRVGAQD